MEANICDINHLDGDVLLPPRKRLLAGFKKQNCDGYGALHPPVVASSSSSASPSSPSPPSPRDQLIPLSPSSTEFQIRLNDFLSSHFASSHNLSPDQIVEASKSVAKAAAKAAEAARTAAQEKAMVAAKAVAAAKNALALVAAFPEEAASRERGLRKNKMKKHVQVQLLYKKHHPVENDRDDEELARKLHRVINSSLRISKNSSSSDGKGHKNKKPKSSPTSERTRVSDGSVIFAGHTPPMGNGHAVAEEWDSDDSARDVYNTRVGREKTSKSEKAGQLEMLDYGEAESSCTKERKLGDAGSPIKKRGRLKLKKLPLSICNFRDQANPKDDVLPKSFPLTDRNMGNRTTRSKPLFPVEASTDNMNNPIEGTSMWKCQEFKSPACVKQNKVLQS